MKTFLFALFMFVAGIALAVWGFVKWGDKVGFFFEDQILGLKKARVEMIISSRNARTEAVRTAYEKAEAENTKKFVDDSVKELENRRVELEKASVKARIEAMKLRNTTPVPATPSPATPPPVIPLSERGKILPETAPTTPPSPAVQVANPVEKGGNVLRVKKGDWFFYTVDRCGNPTLVTTGDLPEVRLEPGESAEAVKTYFAQLLRGAKVVREISGQNLSDFKPMGHLKVKGKEIPIYGILYTNEERM